MPCSQQHPIGFIVLREVMRNSGICRSSVQWIHTLVNHRAVHCIRLTVKIFMNFTRIDCNMPFLAELRYFAVYIRTGGAGQAAFHGMGRLVHDWVRVSFPVHTYIAICPNSQIYGD